MTQSEWSAVTIVRSKWFRRFEWALFLFVLGLAGFTTASYRRGDESTGSLILAFTMIVLVGQPLIPERFARARWAALGAGFIMLGLAFRAM